MKETLYSKISTPILSVVDTFEFTKNLDVALRSVDIKKLKETFEKSSLLNHPEVEDFLLQGSITFKRFNNLDEKIELLSVEDINTKCSACSLGKTVRAYHVKYKKQGVFSVVYSSSFAINLDLINGELYDFAWCNFYLNKEEMSQFTRI
ncbi:hypothetical protein ACHRV6_02410 [Flavobacterium sp. FlaQc-51]|uniref:hypothetical protein n=1 Tax=Flavobacterium sp. FlaQc-51 TaxID=3374184 RepID=UPI003757E9EA